MKSVRYLWDASILLIIHLVPATESAQQKQQSRHKRAQISSWRKVHTRKEVSLQCKIVRWYNSFFFFMWLIYWGTGCDANVDLVRASFRFKCSVDRTSQTFRKRINKATRIWDLKVKFARQNARLSLFLRTNKDICIKMLRLNNQLKSRKFLTQKTSNVLFLEMNLSINCE